MNVRVFCLNVIVEINNGSRYYINTLSSKMEVKKGEREKEKRVERNINSRIKTRYYISYKLLLNISSIPANIFDHKSCYKVTARR